MHTKTSEDLFNELSFYTLGHPDMVYFIHQHAVDAWQAQSADATTKPVAKIFSLVGLYLFLEKGYTGRQVQLAHMEMSKKKNPDAWPKIELPEDRGEITVKKVLDIPSGDERDKMIREWCGSVWQAYQKSHKAIIALAKSEWGL